MANDYMAKLAAELEGNRMNDLASMGRFGDTMVAHINPQEAQMLMEEGGSGTINPMTGLPEFYYGSYDGGDDMYGESTADVPGFDDGPTAAEQAAAQAAALDQEDQDFGDTISLADALEQEDEDFGVGIPLTDQQIDDIAAYYGFGSPSKGVAGAQEGFKGFGEVGLGSLTAAGEEARRDAAKGIYREELWPLLNERGAEYVARALNVPGFFENAVQAYNEGYKGGGPGGTADFFFDDMYEDIGATIQAAKRQQQQEEEEIAKEFEAGYKDTVPTDYFGDLLDTVKGFFGGPSKEDEIMMGQAAKAAGYNFTPMSDAEKYVGTGISYLAPGPIGFAKGLADAIAFATGTRVIGTIDTPMGPLQLTEKGSVQSPNVPDFDVGFGNEPTITKKRKAVTEEPKEEEEKEEEEKDKPYFPRSPLPFTPSDASTLANIYGPDSYLLNQTGLRTLV